MSQSGLSIEQLAAIFRELGVTDPQSWARSEVEEGIPQLAMVLFLQLARSSIDDLRDVRVLRDTIRRAGGRESTEALRRLVDAGTSTSDLLQVVRDVLRDYLTQICFLLDDTSAIRFSGWPRAAELEKIHWGLFAVDHRGRPGPDMSGLHEIVGELFDSAQGDRQAEA